MNERDTYIVRAVNSGRAQRLVAPEVGLSISGVNAAYRRATGHGVRSVPLADAFWARVDTSAGPTGCWPWTAKVASQGYGRLGIRYAHRLAWELAHGPVPAGMCVCHHCDNPPCCNPAHLFVGSHLDNVRDMVAKGRVAHVPLPPDSQPRGERHGQAKLTEGDVVLIRQRVASGESQVSVARAFGRHVVTINSVVHRRTWAHVR